MLIGTSLKMYFSHARTVAWTQEVAAQVAAHPAVAAGRVSAFVIPQYPSIPACVEIGAPVGLSVGAQDIAAHDEGPYTGEVSGAVLAELGCRYVEVGHAERRRLFGDTDEVVAAKVAAAQRNALVPILCVGEAERGSAAAAATEVARQIDSGLAAARAAGLHGEIVVAYEPIWAIGAAEPARADHIRAVCAALRTHLAAAPEQASVIYGGSAGPGLLSDIADAVDGIFLGRFAHEPAAFGEILDEASHLTPASQEDTR
ncbi:triose-phosphate isomerase [Microbacterium sp. zg.Y1090]|uniref:triose-phosphate isomerase family protein n=1 Tax=Microbacterium TaxID=33882 RepID=UPI00214BC403|nr:MULTISPECIES: triose-phosphate isomerase family protein [unclassified Microbacterium]MCR2813785.1 triose-phosphate isomerase [Microbacterium sp. zg.Y1084]MCR2819701.1 triose-phosphate isomerase [Microbacterium sp. zg.Y1090]MDL5487549.1 triose-phosphate isomerase family protein [Microbacterium sp. zg-Y1211]WIM28055.1 triose-phosphate isomerase [Microbacterium sp. zg-Y1090]